MKEFELVCLKKMEENFWLFGDFLAQYTFVILYCTLGVLLVIKKKEEWCDTIKAYIVLRDFAL